MIGRARLLYFHAQQDQAFCQSLEKHLSSLRQEGLLQDWEKALCLAGTRSRSSSKRSSPAPMS